MSIDFVMIWQRQAAVSQSNLLWNINLLRKQGLSSPWSGGYAIKLQSLRPKDELHPQAIFFISAKNICCFKEKYLSFIFSHYSENFMGMMQPSLGAQFALICLHPSHDMFIKLASYRPSFPSSAQICAKKMKSWVDSETKSQSFNK